METERKKTQANHRVSSTKETSATVPPDALSLQKGVGSTHSNPMFQTTRQHERLMHTHTEIILGMFSGLTEVGRALARIWDNPPPLVAAPTAEPPSSLLRSRTSARLLCSLRSTSRTLCRTRNKQHQLSQPKPRLRNKKRCGDGPLDLATRGKGSLHTATGRAALEKG